MAAVILLLTLPFAGQAQDARYSTLKAPLTFIQANDLGRNGYYLQKPIAEKIYQALICPQSSLPQSPSGFAV